MEERLQKILAARGIASRRRAEEFILGGRVIVNGVKIMTLGTKADPIRDRILFDGHPIPETEIAVYLLNKPVDSITTATDEQKRRTVLDLLPRSPRVYPVGRLDRMTEGLLVLTNNGDLALRLTHPRYEHQKVYELTGTSPIAVDDVMKNFARGIKLSDGYFKPDEVKLAGFRNGQPIIRLAIHEGRSHLLRRAASKLQFEITRLKRVQVGPLELGSLPPGKYRRLTAQEIQELQASLATPPLGRPDRPTNDSAGR